MKRKTLQMKRALRSVLLVLLLSAVGMGKMDAQNLIVNGDFEQTTGTLIEYTDYERIWGGGVHEGQFIHDVNSTGHGVGMVGWPQNQYGYGGSGYYLLYNGFGGTTNPSKVAWRQTVTVTPNTTYLFSVQVRNLAQSYLGYSPNPAHLSLKINGQQVGDMTLPQHNDWNEWASSWSSGSTTTQAVIEIFDIYTGDSGSGDDFGIDHLSFTPQATYSVNAVDDNVSMCVTPYQIYQIDVLANDIITPSSQQQGATVQVIQPPTHGSVTWNNSTRKFNYMYYDQSYFGGLDQFKYRVTIPHGEISDAWVYISTGRVPNVGWIDAPGPICAGGPLGIPVPTVEPDQGSGQWVCSQTLNGTYLPFDANNVPFSMNSWYVKYKATNDCGEGYSNTVQISVYQNDNNIVFADANVKAICVANWDTNGDGELSYDEAAAVTDLGQVFRGNTTITSFEELQYFTGLATISDYAFYSCSNLSGSLFIPNSVTTIGDYAFMGCQQITGCLTIPNSVTTIGGYAFYGCSGFTGSLTIGNSVTEIGNRAFNNCTFNGLNINMPNIPSFFINNVGGTYSGSLTIGNFVTSIGNHAFNNCTFNELSINMPNIPNYFIGNIGGTYSGSLTIGNSVTSIGDYAFRNCSGFTGSLTIPNSVTSIGDYAFYNCSGFTGSLAIPNSVTEISDFTFCHCSGFTGSLTIPNSVTTIGGYAFRNCSGLTGSLAIPNSVTTIGGYAFCNCSGFTGITLGNSITTIGNYAFNNCSGFTGSLAIPDSVTEIGSSAFYGCSGFIGTLTLGNSLTTIGNYAFYNCNGFTGDLTILDSVTSIGNYAFRGCNGFTGNLTLGNSVNSIGNCTFYNCSGFTGSLAIPNSVTEIGSSTFYGCSGFTGNLTIGNSVTMIGGGAFGGCSGFTEVFYNATNCAVANSYDSPFTGCSGTLVIGNNVERIPSYMFSSGDFTGSLTISNSVTTIGDYAFYNCSGFTGSLTIPNSMTSISDGAFYNCSGLSSILVFAEIPPTLGSNVFYGINTSIPVYVPCNSIFAYQSAWNEFFNYMPATECDSGDIIVSANPPEGGTVIGVGYYEGGTTCTLIATPNEGFSFYNWMENDAIVSIDVEYSFIVSGDRSLVANFVEGDVCTLIFDLFDSYGDGYTGNYLMVTDENGNSQQLTIERGSSAVFTLPFLTGSHITLTWIVGSYPEDCSFTVSYSNGNVIYHGENLTSSFSYEFDVDCSIVPIENIVFADANVKAICVANWDTNGDGELSYDEAAAVTDLGQVFMENTGITSFEELQYFTGLTTIAEYAFDNCSNLSGSLYIPNSVTSIGYFAFCNCSGLTGSLTIPNSVTSIGDNAFYGCSGFSGNLTIPSSVIEIATNLEMVNPFSGCIGIEQIMVDINNPNYDSRENCNAIIETSTNKLVSGCKNSVIPVGVTTIGNGAFFGYNDFTSSLTIPNSVTTIGNWAFYGCSSLTGDLVIPNSVTTIGNYAFNNCNGFSGMMMFGTIPLTLGYGVFDYSDFPIYVPYESLNDYKTATNWSYYEDRIFPMAYTTVAGYYEGEGNYRFIASPLVENTDPTAVDNMITETAYDLYRFDQSEDAEWQNYKFPENTPNFFLNNGQGYLYANAEDVNLIFKGEFNEDDTKEVGLAYDANAEFAGWNLVGNPFPVNAYANKSYYTMNEDGSAIEPNMVSSATAIPACTGVMVMAESEGETVVFSTDTPEAATNQGCLQIALAQTTTRGNAIQDKAIVSFNAGDRLEKFVFNKENAVISIPQGGKELSIACTNKIGEVPINFKATKNGEYTLTIHSEAVELDYLHLIDNLTGADVDLLVTPAYTFTAKTTDYASRFRLVFSGNEVDGPSAGLESFAFINNGNIVFTGMGGEAFNTSLQIVDVQGRVIVFRDAVPASLSTAGMVPGVYVLRLVNGDDVRTQKLVVR